MKIASWNIRHGGGIKGPLIVEALKEHHPDVIVLVEYHTEPGAAIREELCALGWKHIQSTNPPAKVNGICVLSRTPIKRLVPQFAPPEFMVRWLDVKVPDHGFSLAALHIPVFKPDQPLEKKRFWKAVLKAAQARLLQPFLFIGDFNTGLHRIDERGSTFHYAECFDQLSEIGWKDAWRAFHGYCLEGTWLGRTGNPFRLDHAFVTPVLRERLHDCQYSHKERGDGISDHSILLLELREGS